VADDVEERIELRDRASHERALRQPQVEHALTQAVQVAELEGVEVGESKLAARALRRQRQRHLTTDGQSDDADLAQAEGLLLLRGDLVLVAAGPELDEVRLGQEMHERATPGVIDPDPELTERPTGGILRDFALELVLRECAPRVARAQKARELHGERVVKLDAPRRLSLQRVEEPPLRILATPQHERSVVALLVGLGTSREVWAL
jgi:hypothetical protein